MEMVTIIVIINLFQLSASLPLFGSSFSLLPLPHLSRCR